jgi:hypothetical protein
LRGIGALGARFLIGAMVPAWLPHAPSARSSFVTH